MHDLKALRFAFHSAISSALNPIRLYLHKSAKRVVLLWVFLEVARVVLLVKVGRLTRASPVAHVAVRPGVHPMVAPSAVIALGQLASMNRLLMHAFKLL